MATLAPSIRRNTFTPDRVTSRDTPDAGTWSRQWDSALSSYYLLMGATGLLLLLGLVMVLSATTVTSIAANNSPYAQFLNQGQFALMGLGALVLAALVPIRWYKRLAWPALILAGGLQALTFLPGFALSRGETTGWISLAGIGIQPAEVGKVALALWLGAVLSRKQHLLGQWRHVVFPAGLFSLILIALVLAGNDLGTSIVMCLLVAGALWVAGAPVKLLSLVSVAAMAVVGYYFIYSQAAGYRLARILATFGAECDTSGLCYQTQHGMFALGTGGVFGVGLGSSREKWSYLPEAHNDFIFAIIGEELGLLGTLIVLALFGALGLAMFRVIRRHPDPFVKITTAAVASWVLAQAFINIGVVIGLLPVLGLPLPLVSAGGSALITTMAGLGMVMSFARNEPGAAEALAARTSVVRRSFTVLDRRR